MPERQKILKLAFRGAKSISCSLPALAFAQVETQKLFLHIADAARSCGAKKWRRYLSGKTLDSEQPRKNRLGPTDLLICCELVVNERQTVKEISL